MPWEIQVPFASFFTYKPLQFFHPLAYYHYYDEKKTSPAFFSTTGESVLGTVSLYKLIKTLHIIKHTLKFPFFF